MDELLKKKKKVVGVVAEAEEMTPEQKMAAEVMKMKLRKPEDEEDDFEVPASNITGSS